MVVFDSLWAQFGAFSGLIFSRISVAAPVAKKPGADDAANRAKAMEKVKPVSAPAAVAKMLLLPQVSHPHLILILLG